MIYGHCDHDCYYKREVLNQHCWIPRCPHDTRSHSHTPAPELSENIPTACKRCIHFNGTNPCKEAARAATLKSREVCPYCGSRSINKSYLCGPVHPVVFSGYNCQWCGTTFDRDMIILEIGHDHENSVEYEREKRVKRSEDYETLRITGGGKP